MAKASKTKSFEKLRDPEKHPVAGPGGETHQTGEAAQGSLGADQGVVVADNQNTLKSREHGPSFGKTKKAPMWAREARLAESGA